jgi:hypothetical protein
MSRPCGFRLFAAILVCSCAALRASATCAHAERGIVGSTQYIELIGADSTSSAAIGDAAAMWNSCSQTSSGGIPTVFAGSTPPGAYSAYTVHYHEGLSPIKDVCGHVSANTIDLYQRTLRSGTNVVMDCGPFGYAQNIAHEVGHIFGLGDDFDPGCQGEIMGQVGQSRSVQVDECSMADEMNSTYSDTHDGCLSPQDCHQSPLLLNLGSGPYRLTDLAHGVHFDIDGTGDLESVSWTAGGTEQAFLWLDRNGNGGVDGGTELFGDLTAANGFEALKPFDLAENGGNGDGILDARDAIWLRLSLWVDLNHDGLSQPAEIFSLAEKGVVALGLDYRPSWRVDKHGNLFRYVALLALERNGQTQVRPYYDMYLVKR